MDERLKDELRDVVTYVELSEKAETEFDRRILSDIARDEYSHAKHIKEIMKEHDIPVGYVEEWDKAKQAINKLDLGIA